MTIQFTNNASTTLASGITAIATSLTVATGAGALFPTPSGAAFFYCTLQNVAGTLREIVKVTARTTDTFTIVRAQDGTSGQIFSTSDKVELRVTAADLNNFGQLDTANTWASGQTFVAPVLGTPASGTLTNCTVPTLNQHPSGTAAGLSATLAVGSGGTGAITDSSARTNLGLAIGTNVQAYNANIAVVNALQTFTASQRGTITTANAGSFDESVTNNFQCTPAATVALTFTNHTAGQSGYVLLINTGGYAITAAGTTKLGASTLATISVAGTYLLSYLDNGTNAYVTASGILA